MPEVLRLCDVGFGYAGQPATLHGVSFAVTPGEKIVLLGANGAGKSTLLKLIDGLIAPKTGSIAVFGDPLTPARLKDRIFARNFRRRVALLFQNPDAMLFQPTVRDEIAFGPRQLGLADIETRVAHWAAAFGLEANLERPPFRLSGGEKQKVCLAALLANDPDLLLLDEPTAALDPKSTGWLVDFLAGLPQTVIVSTHNLSLAAELGSRAIVVADGLVLWDGPLAPLLRDMHLMVRANLAHIHRHHHDGIDHAHFHAHDWDS